MARYIDADRFIVDMAENMFTDKTFHEIVQEQPTADVQPVIHAEWEHKQTDSFCHVTGQCSNCKERYRINNYCPNCGAKMVESQESKDRND